MTETMPIRLAVADIDGTLVTDTRIMHPRTVAAIQKLMDHGIYCGIASGRSVDQQLCKEAANWGLSRQFDILIGMNGSELWDNIHQQRHDYYRLKREWIKEIIEMMAPLHLNPFMYYHDCMLCMRTDDATEASSERNRTRIHVAAKPSEMWAEENAKIMFRTTEEQMPQVEAWVNAHPSPYYKGFRTQTTMMEFTDVRVSKAVALKHFCEYNSIPLSQVMTFGDMDNDNEMIACSGYGVCMGSGSPETKKLARFVTAKGNNEDGFADYLETQWFQKLGW